MTSIIETTNMIPSVIPPTTRMNFIKNWWHKSEKTSSIAQARLLQRISQEHPPQIPIYARVGRISIDKENIFSTKLARQMNTLYISQQPNQTRPFQFQSEPTNDLLTDIRQENNNGDKNLVICHGYGAGLGFFYKNFENLSQQPGYRLFAIDWLGMGNSSRPKWTFNKKANQTWDDIVNDVEDHFVESLEDWRSTVGLEKMTLFGHSLGGYFSACYALKYPHRVEKLILVSPAGIPENPDALQAQLQTQQDPQEALQRQASQIGASTMQAAKEPPRPRLPGWVTYLWDRNVTPMSIVRMIGPFGASLVHTYTASRFAHLNESEQHDLYDYLYHITSSPGSGEFALAAVLAPGAYARKPLFHRLADLKMPTVFIYGDHDWMDHRAAEKARKYMKAPSKVVLIPNGGHHMYLDNPDAFNHVIREEMKSPV